MDGPEPAFQAPDKSLTWLIIFSDMLALLLSFFVLLFSMSVVKGDPWEAIVGSLTERLNPLGVRPAAAPEMAFTTPRTDVPRAINLDYLSSIVEEKTANRDLLRQAVIQRLEDRLVISLPSDFLFHVGSSKMTADARRAANFLGGLLHLVGNQVEVGGHTDAQPVKGQGQYISNWELSLARAVVVANALRAGGYERPITASGYADSRFGDLSRRLDESSRQGLARRVDVVIREHLRTALEGNR